MFYLEFSNEQCELMSIAVKYMLNYLIASRPVNLKNAGFFILRSICLRIHNTYSKIEDFYIVYTNRCFIYFFSHIE